MSLPFPSIIQIGDTEFVHLRMEEAAALDDGGRNRHLLFLTPNDDDHFTIFTADHYTGPVPTSSRAWPKCASALSRGPPSRTYDRRPFMPFRGSVRQEDVMAQSTQSPLGEREERLGASDRGVIVLRRLVREAIEAVQRGERPRGAPVADQAERPSRSTASWACGRSTARDERRPRVGGPRRPRLAGPRWPEGVLMSPCGGFREDRRHRRQWPPRPVHRA